MGGQVKEALMVAGVIIFIAMTSRYGVIATALMVLYTYVVLFHRELSEEDKSRDRSA